MRINLYIAKNNLCSRRQADKLILEKKVLVNGQVLKELGYIVQANDQIVVLKKILTNPINNEFFYYLMNKPTNCLCTNKDTHNRRIYLDLIADKDKHGVHLFTIGRLDRDTTGALLITNNGDLYNKLVHPSSHVTKEYIAIAKGLLTTDEINNFQNGLVLKNGVKTQKCIVQLMDKTYDKYQKKYFGHYKIILKEGKKNQIHLSFKVFNLTLSSLTRIKFANLTIQNLKQGEYRKLSTIEIQNLLKN